MWFKFPAGATPFKVGRELGVWCLMTSVQERTKAIMLSCRSVIQLLGVSVFTQKQNQPLRPFEKEIFPYSMDYKSSSFLKWRQGLTRPRVLLGLFTRPTVKGVAPGGNLNHIFTGKTGQNEKKYFGSYLCVRNYSKLQKPYRPYGHFKREILNLATVILHRS